MNVNILTTDATTTPYSDLPVLPIKFKDTLMIPTSSMYDGKCTEEAAEI